MISPRKSASHKSRRMVAVPREVAGPGSGDDTEPEVLCERIKIPVAVQEIIPTLDTASCDDRVNRLTDRDTAPPQHAEILRRLNRDFQPPDLNDQQRSQQA